MNIRILYLLPFVLFIFFASIKAQNHPFKDIAENTAMYVQSVEHQPSLKNHKQFFKAFSQREDKLIKEIKGKSIPIKISASKTYKVIGDARIDNVSTGSKLTFKMLLDLELQNSSGAFDFWTTNLKAVAYNENGFAVAVGDFSRHIDDEVFSDLIVVTDASEIAASQKQMYSDKKMTANISLVMTPWNAREFGNITRIQIVNASQFPEISKVKQRDQQWKDLFTAGKRYTNKRLRVNILGGPKVMPFMGVNLRCDIADFITIMRNKGYDFPDAIEGNCMYVTTIQTQTQGRRTEIIAYSSPTNHIVSWVNYTEEGFKTKDAAMQRLNELRNKKIDEMGLNFIVDGMYYIWRYGYVSYECKEFNIPNMERSWFIVINTFDHPAYCPWKREFYNCLKDNRKTPNTPSDYIEEEHGEGEGITIVEPRPKEDSVKIIQKEERDTIPPKIVKRDATWNPTLLQLCDDVIRNNDVEIIKGELTTIGGFRLSKELFGSGMEGMSSKYPDCDILVKSISKKSNELKILKATIRKKKVSLLQKELEELGYKTAKRNKNDLESFHYYFYEKGNRNVELEEVTSHEYDLVHCSFTLE